MDPNAALQAVRDAITALDHPQNVEQLEIHAADLAEHVRALDEWLTRGGYLPTQWTGAR